MQPRAAYFQGPSTPTITSPSLEARRSLPPSQSIGPRSSPDYARVKVADEEVSYLHEEEGPFLASPYRVSKYDLAEKTDESDTLYEYKEYDRAGQYVEMQNPSWRNGISYSTKSTETQAVNPIPNETNRIGIWLASQYYFRQAVYLISISFLLWIPGLIALTISGANAANNYNRLSFCGVGALWWSVWLSSAWVALWVCYCFATAVPLLLRRWIGVLSTALKRYVSYAEATRCYITFALWTMAVWIIFASTIVSNLPGYSSIDTSQVDPLASSNSTAASVIASSSSAASILFKRGTLSNDPVSAATLKSNAAWLTEISRLLFGLVVCSSILLAEKILMKSIALLFHKTTYHDRILLSNYHISILVSLLSPPSKALTMEDQIQSAKVESNDKKADSMKSRARKFKTAEALRSRTASRDLSGIVTISLTLPVSPFSLQAYVETVLDDQGMSKRLAKQIFSSFAQSETSAGTLVLTEEVIRPF